VSWKEATSNFLRPFTVQAAKHITCIPDKPIADGRSVIRANWHSLIAFSSSSYLELELG